MRRFVVVMVRHLLVALNLKWEKPVKHTSSIDIILDVHMGGKVNWKSQKAFRIYGIQTELLLTTKESFTNSSVLSYIEENNCSW